jgi:transcriptional regulator with XRE-family HTH domain
VHSVHESDDPGDATSSGASAVNEVKNQIGDQIRRARKERGWNQSQLGQAIDVSRFAITRLERGEVELQVDTAKRIEKALDTSGLVDLVRRRVQLIQSQDWSAPWTREAVMARLLSKRGLTRLRVILVDDFDLATALENSPSALATAQIEVIVPTSAREQELYDGDLPTYGHVEGQIKRLSDLDTRPGSSIAVFESRRAKDPVAVALAANGSEKASWSFPYAGKTYPDEVRVVEATASLDGRTVDEAMHHVDWVKEEALRIVKNDVVVVLQDESSDGEHRLSFTRFVAHEQREDALGQREGYAVVLVLVHALCARKDYGVDHRAILYYRPVERNDEGRLSLVSTWLDERDIRRGLEPEVPFGDKRLKRSSDPAKSATRDIGLKLMPDGGVIPIEALREAARREVLANLGIEVSRARFEPIALPASLERIPKAGGALLMPRLLHVELGASDPELDKIEHANVEVLGYEDMAEHDDLNDFLAKAAKSGFLEKTLRDLGIAPR